MRDTDRAFSFIDVLTACTARAHGFDHEILIINGDINGFSNRQNGNRCRRCMNAALCFRIRHALNAMHTTFKFQTTENTCAMQFGNDFLIATHSAFRGRQNLDSPASQTRIAFIHTEQISGEE